MGERQGHTAPEGIRPPPPSAQSSVSIRTAMGRFTFGAEFDLREVVNIDGDTSIKATIIGVAFYDGRTLYQVAYVHNGGAYEPFVDRWRLTRCS